MSLDKYKLGILTCGTLTLALAFGIMILAVMAHYSMR